MTAMLQPMAISDIRVARDIAACISSASTSSMATTVREFEVRREKLSPEKREPIVVKRSRIQLHPAQYQYRNDHATARRRKIDAWTTEKVGTAGLKEADGVSARHHVEHSTFRTDEKRHTAPIAVIHE